MYEFPGFKERPPELVIEDGKGTNRLLIPPATPELDREQQLALDQLNTTSKDILQQIESGKTANVPASQLLAVRTTKKTLDLKGFSLEWDKISKSYSMKKR